jgi:hypothetical protein
MSERSSDLDQELQNNKARDRERKQAQDARAAEEQRKEQRRFRIVRAIDSLRRTGPLNDQTVDEVWLDRLAELREALIDAGKAEVLDQLPDSGTARRITRRCIELLAAGRRPEALALFDGIAAKGELDLELGNEQSFYLPNDLCELLGIPISQPPTSPAPLQEAVPATSKPAPRTNEPVIDEARAEPSEDAPPDATIEPSQGFLSAPDLARQLDMNSSRVESALRRYRQNYPDCFIENEAGGRRRNDPKYLYRVGDVLPHLQNLRNRR